VLPSFQAFAEEEANHRAEATLLLPGKTSKRFKHCRADTAHDASGVLNWRSCHGWSPSIFENYDVASSALTCLCVDGLSRTP
jgi:hypothetical protein